MSNYLSIAAVTEALRNIIQTGIGDKVTGASVTVKQPVSSDASATDAPIVNIYLYEAIPDKSLRNIDLPTRDSSGKLIQKPTLALNLNYLFSFYGNEEKLTPQILMGLVMSTIHGQPFIEPKKIKAVIDSKGADDPIKCSDLGDITEPIKISPLHFSLEDHYRIWSSLQSPFSLSVAYQLRVITVESESDVKAAALPVKG